MGKAKKSGNQKGFNWTGEDHIYPRRKEILPRSKYYPQKN